MTVDGFDDELFDDLDSGGGESKAEQQAYAKFDAKVIKQIKCLLHEKDAAKRRAAAYWLGESGEPKAITALVTAYRKDRNRDVRTAAKYALGMFKSLHEALNGTIEEQNEASRLLRNIVIKNKMGRRISIMPSTLVKAQIGLFVLLVVLIALNLVIPSLKSGESGDKPKPETATPTVSAAVANLVTGPDALQVVNGLRNRLTQIRGDSRNLQQQFSAIQRGDAPDCAITFSTPSEPYTMSPEIQAVFPDVGTIASDLNDANSQLQSAKAIFTTACESGTTLTTDDISQPVETVTTLLRTLTTTFDDRLDTVEENAMNYTPPAPTEAVMPTLTPVEPSATPEPTITPTPIPNTVINAHVNALDKIIRDMSDARGPVELLIQYWSDVSLMGNTGGCQPPYPEIAEDYDPATNPDAVWNADIQAAYPELVQAIEQVNTGLALTRNGWNIFTAACANQNLVAQATTGSQFMTTAKNAFEVANSDLDTVIQKIRAGQ